jgi:hypothetical protein
MPEGVREAAFAAVAAMFTTPKVFPTDAAAFWYLQSALESGNPKLVDLLATSLVLHSMDTLDFVDRRQPLVWMGDAYEGLGKLLLQIVDGTPGQTLHLLLHGATNAAESRGTMALLHSLLLAGGPDWAQGNAEEQRNHVLRRLTPGVEWGDIGARLALDARLRQLTTPDAWLHPLERGDRPRVATAKTWIVWGTETAGTIFQHAFGPQGISAHALMAALALLPDWDTTRRLPHADLERALAPFLNSLFGPTPPSFV